MAEEGVRRVLVVEDEAMVSMLIEDMLVDLGYQVVGPAARVDAALSLAKGEALDAAILDLNLNGEQTTPVAMVLRGRDIPFLFATGYGAGGLPGEFASVPTLQKPFVLDALREALEQLTAGAPLRPVPPA